eukprot:TRINITY_DN5749_c0_g1_i2.p1 TRINITY_DN5749_c0_g1~~TRINITY_DN5749_c0_g1_i2.p1  ORF type:complete len:631 (+),score=127.61 TRINITY_DN5749_c0_g1_i2:3903-5795(+)
MAFLPAIVSQAIQGALHKAKHSKLLRTILAEHPLQVRMEIEIPPCLQQEPSPDQVQILLNFVSISAKAGVNVRGGEHQSMASIMLGNTTLLQCIHRRLNEIRCLFPGKHSPFPVVPPQEIHSFLQRWTRIDLTEGTLIHGDITPPQDYAFLKLELELNKLAQVNEGVLDLILLTQILFRAVIYIDSKRVSCSIMDALFQFQGYLVPRVLASLFGDLALGQESIQRRMRGMTMVCGILDVPWDQVFTSKAVANVLLFDDKGGIHHSINMVECLILRGISFASSAVLLLQRIVWLLLSSWDYLDDAIRNRWKSLLHIGWKGLSKTALLHFKYGQLAFLETEMKEVLTLCSKAELLKMEEVSIAFPPVSVWLSWELGQKNTQVPMSVYANWVQHLFLSIQHGDDIVSLIKSWILCLLSQESQTPPVHIVALTRQLCDRISIEGTSVHWLWELVTSSSDLSASRLLLLWDWVPSQTVFPFGEARIQEESMSRLPDLLANEVCHSDAFLDKFLLSMARELSGRGDSPQNSVKALTRIFSQALSRSPPFRDAFVRCWRRGIRDVLLMSGLSEALQIYSTVMRDYMSVPIHSFAPMITRYENPLLDFIEPDDDVKPPEPKKFKIPPPPVISIPDLNI